MSEPVTGGATGKAGTGPRQYRTSHRQYRVGPRRCRTGPRRETG